MTHPQARLLYAAGEHDADMRRLSGFEAPDPLLYVAARGKSWLLATDLEIDRARREAAVDHVAAWSDFDKEPAPRGAAPRRRDTAATIAAFLRSIRVTSALVPASFPAGLFEALKARGIRLTPSQSPLFVPEREFKTAAEIRLLRQAARIAEAGIARAFEILRAAKTAPNRSLTWGGAVLTAERLRAEMEIACLRHGGRASGTIVACGSQGCDPHERGRGPLRSGSLIILDIFPRAASGYYGDITRTVVKGRASDAQRRLWEAVLKGQKLAISRVRPGADGAAIHQEVTDLFTSLGFPTEIRNGRRAGFFHGTGHGLGLELHEAPRFAATRFKPGQVFTVEPGLYYPGLGGVRHEDVIVVTETGARLLTKIEKPLEL